MSKSRNNNSRRNFIKMAAGATIAAGTSQTLLATNPKTFLLKPDDEQTGNRSSPVSANDKVQIALIGAGGQGTSDTMQALRVPGVELVAVADVYDGRLVRAKEIWGDKIFTTRDYREVLNRPEVDAVIIATPDHWHMQMAVDALERGKHVYVEKPVVQQVSEGKRVIDAQRKSGRVVQVGSQRVSSIVYRKAKELLAAGVIGELNLVEAFINRNSPIGAWQYSIPPDATPQNIDWDRFLAKAQKRPFQPIRRVRRRT